MEMVLASDIVIAANHAEFALTEVKLGSIPGSGGTQLLPRITSRSNALLYLLTGDRMSAEEAFRLGVVSQLCAPEALMAAARGIAERIAGNAPLSVAAIKRLVNKGRSMPLDQAMTLERYAFGLLAGSEDRAEGRAAFREKRKPNFKGQ
jgi:E-phenylitaconyl-CoA hydratase